MNVVSKEIERSACGGTVFFESKYSKSFPIAMLFGPHFLQKSAYFVCLTNFIGYRRLFLCEFVYLRT